VGDERGHRPGQGRRGVPGERRRQLSSTAGQQIGGWIVDVGHVLLVTSILAAMISFHNTTARYMFALGREGCCQRRSAGPRTAPARR